MDRLAYLTARVEALRDTERRLKREAHDAKNALAAVEVERDALKAECERLRGERDAAQEHLDKWANPQTYAEWRQGLLQKLSRAWGRYRQARRWARAWKAGAHRQLSNSIINSTYMQKASRTCGELRDALDIARRWAARWKGTAKEYERVDRENRALTYPQVAKMRQEINALRAFAGRAVECLCEVEWTFVDEGCCPACGLFVYRGGGEHSSTCALAGVLREWSELADEQRADDGRRRAEPAEPDAGRRVERGDHEQHEAEDE